MSPNLFQSMKRSFSNGWERIRRKKENKKESSENTENELSQEDRTIIDLKRQQARLIRLIHKVGLDKMLWF